jgi:sugar phosphate isomerase/epimerase
MKNHRLDRRGFLKAAGAAGVGLAGLGNGAVAAEGGKGKGAPSAEKLGWRLGCQAWTFNDVTFYDAMDKTAGLGLHFIEAFPGQRLRPDQPGKKFDEGLSEADRKEVKKRLGDLGLKLVNYGVGGSGKRTFDFAKDMGIETIVSEPEFNAFDGLDKLVEEYGINVALHNHPKPSRYWNPETVLTATKGHNKRIGACCDIGHWVRSGVNPLEALRLLEGRIISFHFKDLNKKGPDAHDVPWGTGVSDVKGLLTEVKRQGIKPVFSVEYEYHFGTSMPELQQCVAYFEKVCAELARG